MRLYEIQGFGAYPNEELLLEGWLDSVKKTLGDKVSDTVNTVSNTSSALQVFYKIGTNKQYLESVTFLIKKDIKNKLKYIGDGPLMSKLKKMVMELFPEGRGLMDFIKGCILCAVLKMAVTFVDKYDSAKKIAAGVADGIKDQAQELVGSLLTKLASLDNMVDSLSQASGIFTILKALGVANSLLFELLTNINSKIASTARPAS